MRPICSTIAGRASSRERSRRRSDRGLRRADARDRRQGARGRASSRSWSRSAPASASGSLRRRTPGLRVGRVARRRCRRRSARGGARQRRVRDPRRVPGDRDRRRTPRARSPSLDLWRDDVLGDLRPTTRSRSRSRPRRRRSPPTTGSAPSSRPTYGDAAIEAAIANSLGVEATSRRTTCSVASFALAGEGVETRAPGYGFSAGRSFAELDVDVTAARRGRARGAAARCRAAATRGGCPWCSIPLVTRSLLAIIGAALSGEAVVKGRSMFVGRDGETGRRARRHARRRSDRSPRRSARRRYDAEGVPTPAAWSSSSTACSAASCTTSHTGRRAGTATTGLRGARWVRVDAGRRRPGAARSRPGAITPEAILAKRRRGALRAVGRAACTRARTR